MSVSGRSACCCKTRCGECDDQVDALSREVLDEHWDVRNLSLRMRADDFKVAVPGETALDKTIEEALHAKLGACFRREVQQADSGLTRAARRAAATCQCKRTGGLDQHAAASERRYEHVGLLQK
jgi:hypothetical protein